MKPRLILVSLGLAVLAILSLGLQAQGSFKIPASFTQGLSVQYVNTGLATLAGFEFYAEIDVTDCLTTFSTMSSACACHIAMSAT